MRPQWYWTDNKIRMHVFMRLTAATLTEMLRRLLDDSAGIGLTKQHCSTGSEAYTTGGSSWAGSPAAPSRTWRPRRGVCGTLGIDNN